MNITNEIIESYFECHYKSHLKLKGFQGQKCNLEQLQASDTERLKTKYFTEILKTTYNRDYATDVSLGDVMKHGQDHIFNTEVLFDVFRFHCDFLRKIPLKSKFGNFAYVPVLIIPTENIPRKTKILVAGIANALSKIQASPILFAEIVYGKKFKSATIKLNTYLEEFNQE
jgi:predicted RecB family nuclease